MLLSANPALVRRPSLPLPVALGTQGDIQYLGVEARGMLNPPESTQMGFWSLNPYIGCAFGCTYCYARYAHRYVVERNIAADDETGGAGARTDRLPDWLAFERRIFVKENAVEVLRRTLQGRAPRLAGLFRGETLVIGTATDPYQPAERQHRLTRGMIEVLAERRGMRVVIITKSPLVARDVDVLGRLAGGGRSRVTIHLSLITLDRAVARQMEPRAPTPESRVRALRRLSEAGIDVGINIMPVLPGITDRPSALRALVRTVAAAGASHVNMCALRLGATARRRYLPFIDAEFPHLVARYRRAYAERDLMNDAYREELRRVVREACQSAGIAYGTPEESGTGSDGTARAGGAWTPGRDEQPAAHGPDVQMELTL